MRKQEKKEESFCLIEFRVELLGAVLAGSVCVSVCTVGPCTVTEPGTNLLLLFLQGIRHCQRNAKKRTFPSRVGGGKVGLKERGLQETSRAFRSPLRAPSLSFTGLFNHCLLCKVEVCLCASVITLFKKTPGTPFLSSSTRSKNSTFIIAFGFAFP